MLKLNLSKNVRVKLTTYGRGKLLEQHVEYYKNAQTTPDFKPPKEDIEGYSEWTLWNLMNRLGPTTYMGGEMPFEPDFLYDENS